MILGLIVGAFIGAGSVLWGIIHWLKQIGNIHKVTPLDFMDSKQRKELQAFIAAEHAQVNRVKQGMKDVE